MIFHLKATIWKVFWHDFPPQGNYMKSILTWFSSSRQLNEENFDMIFHLKATLWKVIWHDFPSQGNYMKSIFDMIFHLKAAQNFIAEHEERDFELIFRLKRAQNVVRRHYERDFDMIFHLKLETPQNLFRQHHERDFHMIFHLKKSRKFSCKVALRRKYYFDMNFLFMAPQIWIAEH